MNGPTTRAEAEKTTYGGAVTHYKFNAARCAESIGGMWSSHQCERKPGHGPDGLYCKQHDPIAKQAKRNAEEAKRRANMLMRDMAYADARGAAHRLGVGAANYDGRVVLTTAEAHTLADELGRAR